MTYYTANQNKTSKVYTYVCTEQIFFSPQATVRVQQNIFEKTPIEFDSFEHLQEVEIGDISYDLSMLKYSSKAHCDSNN